MRDHSELSIQILNSKSRTLANQVKSIVESYAKDAAVEKKGHLIWYDTSYKLVWFEDLQMLATDLARLCKGRADFAMSGAIDTFDSSGEYMDYRFEFQSDILSSEHSEWYTVYTGTSVWHDDYAEFCEDFDTAEDKQNKTHRFSKDFFGELKNTEEWYCSKDGFGPSEIWKDGVHMRRHENIRYCQL